MTPLHTKIMGNSSLPDAQHSSMVVQLDCSHELYQNATFLWNWFQTSWLKFSPVLTIPWYVSYWPLLACTYFFFLAITLHPQTSFALEKCYAARHLMRCRMTEDFSSLTCSPLHFIRSSLDHCSALLIASLSLVTLFLNWLMQASDCYTCPKL